MRKFLIPVLMLVLLLALPLAAQALTVSGTLQQLSKNGAVPLADLAVNLENRQGTTLTARTAANGEWRFSNVEAGVYRIRVRLPQGHVAAPIGDNSRFLPSNSENVLTPWMEIREDVKIPLGSSRTTAGISISAFVDSNENGGHMSTEPALAGVEVSVYADGYTDLDPIASGTTNKKGELSLPGMSPGTYRLKAVLPSGYMAGPTGTKVNIYYNCFRLNDQGEAWTDPITLEKGTQGMGVGAVAAGSARGMIWLDQNENGLRDANETGFTGAEVSVTSESQGFSVKASVNEDGSFVFDPLQPGEYSFRVTLPDGWMFDAPGSGSFLTGGYSRTDAAPISVSREKATEIRPVGVIPASGLSVQFYLDENANGRMDEDEMPCRGALSILADGQEVLAVQTDGQGIAAAPVVRAGDLTLTARTDESDRRIFSVPGSQNDFGAGTAETSVSVSASLGRGEQKTLYAGLTEPAAVSGQVYLDTNGNGIWDPLEGTLPEMTVQVVDTDGLVTAETVTDKSGAFVFSSLVPKDQVLRFLLVDPYIASVPEDAAETCITHQTAEYGETDTLQLKPGRQIADLQAALFKASTAQGHVLVHEAEGTVTGLAGVSVALIRRDGTPYSDYTNDHTDENGFFYLKGILPGEYTVLYTLPEHALLETADALTVYSPYFTCADGSETELPDVFAVRTAQAAGTVTLDGAPVSAAVTAVNEESGTVVTVETDPKDGSFDLSLLRPGLYTLTVALPEELVFGADTMLVPARAASVSSAAMTLAMGQRLTDQAVTVAWPARVSGIAYWDADHSGQLEPGENSIPGLTLTLLGMNGETVETLTTDEAGFFESSPLVPDQYVIAVSLEEDCILAGGRQQSLTDWALDICPESGESLSQNIGVLRFSALGGQLWSLDGAARHVGGLKISLLLDGDDVPIMETLTDEDGRYAFPRLYPGVYRIRADLPEDFGFARVSDTEDRVSVILSNSNTGVSEPFTLTMGLQEYGADIGFGAKGSIGDFAWLDADGNGMQDIGEKGIPGIVLALYQGDELVAQTETDVYGHYMFKDLYPGKYILKVTMPKELTATVHQTEFPLINSILPQMPGLTVETEVMIPSGATTLSDDIGFLLVTEGVYPDAMDRIPTIDWSNGGRKNR